MRLFLERNIIAPVSFCLTLWSFFSEMHSLVLPAIRKHNGIDGDGILEVCVSFDGACKKRGYKSYANVGFVSECAWFVFEYEIVSNACMVCTNRKSKLSEAEFAA